MADTSMDVDPPHAPAAAASPFDALSLLASAAGAAQPSPLSAHAPLTSASSEPVAVEISASVPPASGKAAKPKKPRASKVAAAPADGSAKPGKGWRKGLKGAVKTEEGVAATVASSPGATPEIEDGPKPVKKRAAPGQGKRALAAAAAAKDQLKIPKLSTEGTGGAVATPPQPTYTFPVGPAPKVRSDQQLDCFRSSPCTSDANPGVLQAQALERGTPSVRQWRFGDRPLQSITGYTYSLPTWRGADDSPYAVSRRAALAAQANEGSGSDYEDSAPAPPTPLPPTAAAFGKPAEPQTASAAPPEVPASLPPPSPPKSSLPPSLAALMS